MRLFPLSIARAVYNSHCSLSLSLAIEGDKAPAFVQPAPPVTYQVAPAPPPQTEVVYVTQQGYEKKEYSLEESHVCSYT